MPDFYFQWLKFSFETPFIKICHFAKSSCQHTVEWHLQWSLSLGTGIFTKTVFYTTYSCDVLFWFGSQISPGPGVILLHLYDCSSTTLQKWVLAIVKKRLKYVFGKKEKIYDQKNLNLITLQRYNSSHSGARRYLML